MRYPKVVFLQSEGVVVLENDGCLRTVVNDDLPLLMYTISEERDLYSQSLSYLAYLAKFEELHTSSLKKRVDRSAKIERLIGAFGATQEEIDDCGIAGSVYRNERFAVAALTVLGL